MNDKENKAFIECKKAIERLLIRERQAKATLECIHQEKLRCLRVLLDDEYCKEVEKNEKRM